MQREMKELLLNMKTRGTVEEIGNTPSDVERAADPIDLMWSVYNEETNTTVTVSLLELDAAE